MSAPGGKSSHSGTSRVAATVVWFAKSSSQLTTPKPATTLASSERSPHAHSAHLRKRSRAFAIIGARPPRQRSSPDARGTADRPPEGRRLLGGATRSARPHREPASRSPGSHSRRRAPPRPAAAVPRETRQSPALVRDRARLRGRTYPTNKPRGVGHRVDRSRSPRGDGPARDGPRAPLARPLGRARMRDGPRLLAR